MRRKKPDEQGLVRSAERRWREVCRFFGTYYQKPTRAPRVIWRDDSTATVQLQNVDGVVAEFDYDLGTDTLTYKQ
jgi:hypothetical protein